jgi:thioesterase domain-containing protein
VFSKLCNHTQKYGYRLGTVEEANALGLIDIPQTEEQLEKNKQKYYFQTSAYDYENESFFEKEVNLQDEIEKLRQEMMQMFTDTVADMKKTIQKQQEEIQELSLPNLPEELGM